MKWHPSKDIIETCGNELKDKKIVLCLTGSVAATRSSEIARQLMRYGAEIITVMSPMAQKIIHPNLMEWATGNPVVTELTGEIEHVTLAGEHLKKVDLVLIAPATANTISKIACGIDDTTVTSVASTAFGSGTPIVIVPAMHKSMYNHQILTENISKLQALGVNFVGPRIEEGKAKIAKTEEVVKVVIQQLTSKRDLEGKKIMITAGSTIEYIDPMRVITNKSSGKMGIAIANEAVSRGAKVTLIYGPGTALPPKEAKIIRVETTKEMYEAVVSELKSARYDIVIASAAVADWALEKPYAFKIPTKDVSEITLKLIPTFKIVDAVKKVSPNTLLIPFRAVHNLSDDALIQSGYERLKGAKADLIAVNDVGRSGVGFGFDTNELFIVDKDKKVVHIPLAPKLEVARKLLDVIFNEMKPT